MTRRRDGRLPSPCYTCKDRRDCRRSVLRNGVALCERDIWVPLMPGPDWRDRTQAQPLGWVRL